jgi:hypothetical protein
MFCSCCNRRSADAPSSSSGRCDCGPWYCRTCLLCVGHCRSATPGRWVDAGDELDEDAVEAKPDVILASVELPPMPDDEAILIYLAEYRAFDAAHRTMVQAMTAANTTVMAITAPSVERRSNGGKRSAGCVRPGRRCRIKNRAG